MCVDVGVSRRGPRGASSPTWFLGPSFAGVSGWDPETLVLAGVATLSFQTQCCGLRLMTVRDSEPRGMGGWRKGLSPCSLCGDLSLLNGLGGALLCPHPGWGWLVGVSQAEPLFPTLFLLVRSWAWPTQSYLCAHLSPSFRTTCFWLPDLANKNRDAQLNLDFG